MAIEEKQRILEFTFVPNNIDGDLKYDITYNDRNEAFPLRISAGGNGMDYPLDLVIEIVEFLTSKGVISSKVLSRTIKTPGVGSDTISRKLPIGVEPGSFAASLLPPMIERGEVVAVGSPLTSNIDPLASFDINGSSGSIPTPEIVEKTEGVLSVPEIIKSASEDTVIRISAPIIPTIPPTETAPIAPSSEMISRPVIRSRVTGGDPQSAEKEAAMIRASSSKGAEKTIRKVHRGEGE